MIAPMKKFTFLLYHLDYESFLADLQSLGVVHIIRSKAIVSEGMAANQVLIEKYTEGLKFLRKYLSDKSEAFQTQLGPKMLLNQMNSAREKTEVLAREKDILIRQINEIRPWGNFRYDLIEKLAVAGVSIKFYSCPRNMYKVAWEEEHHIEQVSEEHGQQYFMEIVHGVDSDPEPIEADLFTFPEKTLKELQKELATLEEELDAIETYFSQIAKTASQSFEDEIQRLTGDYEFEEAINQGDSEAEDHIRMLGGWIPQEREAELKDYLKNKDIIFFEALPKAEDEVPILLKNNRFAEFFEPISRMFMLPKYNDLDLTPFFAPFFMLFFGFCNADIAYGIILILLSLLIRKKSKNQGMKNMMMLVMLFGVSTIIMGWVMGSMLAFDMKLWAGIGGTVPIREMNHIFNFAIVLGVIQILFGILLNAYKQIKQNGFMYGIAPIGIFLFLLSAVIMGSPQLGAKPGAMADHAKYVMYLGLFMIFFFNSPGKNIIINILSGLWKMYNVVTGFFGDLLSYIRLFALGVSSGILGLVVNSMAGGMLNIPYIGWLIFFVFMVFGHTLNLALGALGGFVHPLRLTFVEFYKNAEFSGPGIEYKPFGRKNTVK